MRRFTAVLIVALFALAPATTLFPTAVQAQEGEAEPKADDKKAEGEEAGDKKADAEKPAKSDKPGDKKAAKPDDKKADEEGADDSEMSAEELEQLKALGYVE